jgi:hypothetical protein
MSESLFDFIETKVFENQNRTLGDDRVFFRIQEDLIRDPNRGDVIQGTGGARKARVADPESPSGKSGGFRYIYLYLEHRGRIYMLYLFKKNQQADLSPEQKKTVKALVDSIKKGR